MSKPDVFATSHSSLNAFLFADIGTEPGGMTLSVLSALARLDVDPWQEAARLATLPRLAATDGLARAIASLPASLWPLAEATPIAIRLVALLPGASHAAVASMDPTHDRRAIWSVLVTLLMTFVLGYMLSHAVPAGSAPGTPAGALAEVGKPAIPAIPH
jgi:hypothetical protein